MLPAVSTICFAASYAIALGIELSRFFFRFAVRKFLVLGFTAAGLFAHVVYLVLQAESAQSVMTWYFACLVLSAVLMICYFVLAMSQTKSTVGLFLIPTCLALIGVAQVFPTGNLVRTIEANRAWGLLHGLALLLGTLFVLVGFIAGILYLIQSRRLKQKLPPHSGFWFPSLEKLQLWNERLLHGSVGLLGVGLVSGIVLNFASDTTTVPWSSPIVWSSAVWLVWLIAVIVFHLGYKPARQGRKVAYLTVGSFLFLSLVLSVLLLFPSHHA